MKQNRPRPTALSDPFYDFRPEALRNLLATPDDQLKWHHFQDFLGPHLPAGTYAESVYFLPGAFRLLQEGDPNSLDLVTPVIGFVSKNAAELSADGLLEAAREEIRKCFNFWTQKFHIIHFDLEACRQKGWRLNHQDLVEHSETICEALRDLDRFESQGGLADEFIARLSRLDATPVESAWFLELVRAQYDVRPPPARGAIQSLFGNLELLLEKKAAVLASPLGKPNSPTYWNDTLKEIGISD